ITLLFWSILSTFSASWEEHVKYYSLKIAAKKLSLFYYSDHLVQTTLNRIHPSKICRIKTPSISDPDYCLSNDETDGVQSLSGLCLGTCIDFMNRFKRLNTLDPKALIQIADTFEPGSTQEGFIYHNQLNQLEISDLWVEKNLPDPAFKDLYFAKTISFFTKNYKSKLIQANKVKDLCDGDYFLKEESIEKRGFHHLICLIKREQNYMVFDPNYGTLIFNDHLKLNDFIEGSTRRMFDGSPSNLTFFHCKDKKA
ncbi:MAG: YopT-type cysteine protease domain-containing protein, partial [Parachlamydiaceae bacterium]